MNKLSKKIMIFLILLALIIVGLEYYRKTDFEAICNIAGGHWNGVHGCNNYCDREGKFCPDKLIFGCECGLEKCWDGEKCVKP